MEEYLYSLATDKRNGCFAGIVKCILFLLSLIYGCAVRLVSGLYHLGILKVTRLAPAVISVGNVTMGGTGKTPLVALLVDYFQQQGKKIAILTRGYMKKVSSSTSADEPTVLSERFPSVDVLVGRNRIANARKALESNAYDVMLLDDGFQHWRLHRDLDIVTIDSSNPFGNKRIIPRGILREPLSSLKRVDIVVLTKTDIVESGLEEVKKTLRDINPDAMMIESAHKPLFLKEIDKDEHISLSALENSDICLVCSIGDPLSFKKLVEKQGAHAKGEFVFLDHHQFSEDDIERIINFCSQESISTIVTTEKDAIRLRGLSGTKKSRCRILVLHIALTITSNEKGLRDRLSIISNI
ncbi:tetraacyldisaccharide 4'-kinase [Candidatus Omnitrophota bacterium]